MCGYPFWGSNSGIVFGDLFRGSCSGIRFGDLIRVSVSGTNGVGYPAV